MRKIFTIDLWPAHVCTVNTWAHIHTHMYIHHICTCTPASTHTHTLKQT